MKTTNINGDTPEIESVHEAARHALEEIKKELEDIGIRRKELKSEAKRLEKFLGIKRTRMVKEQVA